MDGNYINGRVNPSIIGGGCPQERKPDQQVSCEFLGPEKGMVEDISTKYLHDYNNGHTYAKRGKRIFNPSVCQSTGVA